jgi:uncharacterized protein
MHHLINFALSPRARPFVPFVIFYLISQIFWIVKLRRWKRSLVKNKVVSIALGVAGWALYAGWYVYAVWNLRRVPSPVTLTPGEALLQGPFEWWVFSSFAGFAFYLAVWISDFLWRLSRRASRRSVATSPVETTKQSAAEAKSAKPGFSTPIQPERRVFFRRVATTLGLAPFAAGAYGFLYGRLDLKIHHQRIGIPHLPRALDGFSILQLSDLHIGPFMTARQIRTVAAIANGLKPDLTVLTGDFVTFDGSTQYAVVDALSGLKAPFGVLGCLGNHEIYTGTQASITGLFAGVGFRMLRQESTLIHAAGEAINLIGVDYETTSNHARGNKGYVRNYLEGVERLVIPGFVNILLSHNPNTFDRAVQLGIDFSIAGHTHGGQIDLEFLNTNICPARLVTPYVRGWFQKGKGQLYVNRGIGTIIMPIRFDAPPEITVYHLTRSV